MFLKFLIYLTACKFRLFILKVKAFVKSAFFNMFKISNFTEFLNNIRKLFLSLQQDNLHSDNVRAIFTLCSRFALSLLNIEYEAGQTGKDMMFFCSVFMRKHAVLSV